MQLRACRDSFLFECNHLYTQEFFLLLSGLTNHQVSISGWNIEEQKYKTDLFLKYKDVDSWKLIEDNTLEFDASYKTICSAVLKKVSELYAENFFDYYIDRYEYELKCADKGNELFESEGAA